MNHSDFIEALGDGTFIADKLSIERNAVYAWKIRNNVPWKWRRPLLALAKKKKIPTPIDF